MGWSCAEMGAAAAEGAGVVREIGVVAGSCVGICAMMASTADITVMAKDASLYFADMEGDASAEAALAAGVADILADDGISAVLKARELVTILPLNNLSIPPVCESAENPAAAPLDDLTDPDALAAAVCHALRGRVRGSVAKAAGFR